MIHFSEIGRWFVELILIYTLRTETMNSFTSGVMWKRNAMRTGEMHYFSDESRNVTSFGKIGACHSRGKVWINHRSLYIICELMTLPGFMLLVVTMGAPLSSQYYHASVDDVGLARNSCACHSRDEVLRVLDNMFVGFAARNGSSRLRIFLFPDIEKNFQIPWSWSVIAIWDWLVDPGCPFAPIPFQKVCTLKRNDQILTSLRIFRTEISV